jgi:hypothetical protein
MGACSEIALPKPGRLELSNARILERKGNTMPYSVKPETLDAYLRVVFHLRSHFYRGRAALLAELDKRRKELHDELLAQAGVNRENFEFICWINDLLDAQEAA